MVKYWPQGRSWKGVNPMRKAIFLKKEKFKWLTALCLCLLCFSLCLGMLIKPTYADEPGYLKELDRIGAWRWDDANWGQKKDSFGDMQGPSCAIGGAFTEPGVLGWARYRLGGEFTTFSGKLACADAGTADAAMRLNIYADSRTEPVYTSPVIRRDTRIFAFQADVIGANEIRIELVQAEAPALPEGQASSAFALLVDSYLLKAKRTEQSAHLKDVALLDSTWNAVTFTGNRDSRDNWHQASAKLGGVLNAAGAMGQARYQLDGKYDVFYGQLACAEEGAADAVMQVKFYSGGSATPFYTSPLIKRSTGLAEFLADVRGVAVLRIEVSGTTDPVSAQSPLSGWILLSNPYLTPVAPAPTTTTTGPTTTNAPLATYTPVTGWTGLYKRSPALASFPGEYAYSFTRNPETDSRLLPVYAKTSRVLEDISIVNHYGAYNNAELVLIALRGVAYPTVIQSVTLGGRTFSLPSGGALMAYAQNRFYSLAEAFAQNILRGEDIATIADIFSRPVPPDYPPLSAAQALKIKEDFLKGIESEYYVNALKNNVYVRLRRDGKADFGEPGAAIWAGPDLAVGTADDRTLVLREGSFFYEESPGVWRFVVSRFDYEDPRWAAWEAAPTTTAPTTSTSGPTGSIVTSTTNGFLTTTDTEGPPKTGVPFNAGLFVCVALLFMSCLYCGYRVVKKERA